MYFDFDHSQTWQSSCEESRISMIVGGTLFFFGGGGKQMDVLFIGGTLLGSKQTSG